MGKMDEMLGMFKRKDDPYADLKTDIAEQTGEPVLTNEEEATFLINEKTQDEMEELANGKSPEMLN